MKHIISQGLIILLSVLLLLSVVCPASTRDKQQNQLSSFIPDSLTLNSLSNITKIEKTTITRTVSIAGIQENITITRYDIMFQNGSNYIKLDGIYRPSKTGEYGLLMETELIPLSRLEKVTKSRVLAYNPVRYEWDGIIFIDDSSTPLYVRYDHPDNGPYENPRYDIPPNERDNTVLHGNSKLHTHIPTHIMQKIKEKGTLAVLIQEIMTPILFYMLGVPELVGTKLAALALAIVEGVIALLGYTFNWWLDNILTTELSDGWTWLWGFGGAWIFKWWAQSFGAWRDTTFFFVGFRWGGEEMPNLERDPFYWYNPFQTRAHCIWYHSTGTKVWWEIKSASTSAIAR
ncbi:MAG: hypothetical protein QW146_08365 [Candidatus Bathyarchaeia archaeon]